MSTNDVVSIRRILEASSEFSWWLYLPPQPWTLETEGAFSPYTKDADPANIPAAAKHNGWEATLNSDAIEDIAANAVDQVDNPTIDPLFEAFLFYFENDAFILF
ncbi:hypothetical protein LJR230_004327 [Trinickia sp. LjRoot230]|uniref:DUF7716 domain-containing protein n=1 Tax=Trinickia sp. LjRoot230 TaxID=3342288 RepID=UPI003ED0B360